MDSSKPDATERFMLWTLVAAVFLLGLELGAAIGMALDDRSDIPEFVYGSPN